MGAIQYFVISTQALSMMLLIGAAGYMLRLGKAELKVLAQINISLLTPALLFSKITKSQTREMLVELWFIPVLYVLLGFIGLEWARRGGRLLRLPDGFGRLCILAVYFSNVNSILIPIIEGITSSPASRFLLRDESDSMEAVADRSIAYGMIIGIMNNLLRWSIGVAIMRPEPDSYSGSNASLATLEQQSEPRNAIRAEPNAAEASSRGLIGGNDDEGEGRSGLLTTETVPLLPAKAAASPSNAVGVLSRAWRALLPLMTPPLCSVVLAVVVVCVPQLQARLLSQGTYTYSVWSAIDVCGQACVPLTLLALGGQLGVDRHAVSAPREAQMEYEPVGQGVQNKGIVLVLLGRFLVVPAFSCAALIGIYYYVPWLVPVLRTDPVLFLTLAIVSATPPAVNLLTVAQKLGMYESEAARMLSISYVAGLLALSVEVSGFLWLASLIHG
ncbi:hypothetical protein GGI07_003782 [Coemansia sp. Benny D115]|nr:hypothetical protein GGI07_003782 [Coemansia sp. Benny D115]